MQHKDLIYVYSANIYIQLASITMKSCDFFTMRTLKIYSQQLPNTHYSMNLVTVPRCDSRCLYIRRFPHCPASPAHSTAKIHPEPTHSSALLYPVLVQATQVSCLISQPSLNWSSQPCFSSAGSRFPRAARGI